MKAFPQPLSREEEQFYMQKYTEGDLTAKHILIERNLRLVAHIVKKYQHADTDQEDFISIGTIGLIKAVTTFNPKRNNHLASYAARCIENEILMFLRSKKKSSKEVSLYDPIGTDCEGNEIQLYDILETEELDTEAQIALHDDIQLLYTKVESELSPRERLVLKLRYGLYNEGEYTQREVASQLGISRSMSLVSKRALSKNYADIFNNTKADAGNRNGTPLFRLSIRCISFFLFYCLSKNSLTFFSVILIYGK